MAYKTINEFIEEPHPWPPHIPDGATKLILGTFPTAERNRGAYEFFYPNPLNDFWEVIFQVADKILKDFVDEDPIVCRHNVLKELKLAIGDIGKRVLRQKNSSKDENLFPVEYTDILSILEKYPLINKVIVTSSSSCHSVLSWFHHYCFINGISFEIPKGKLPLLTSMNFKNRKIKIEVVPSTSKLSRIKGIPRLEMYKKAILEIP